MRTIAKKRGRPPNDKYRIAYMTEKIDEYIEASKDIVPILKECCLLNGWNYDHVMRLQRENSDLYQSVKKLLNWKEIALERGALNGTLDKTMAIFSLKQPAHGWTDKHEVAIERKTSALTDEIEAYINGDDK